jgi:hypothetical protein
MNDTSLKYGLGVPLDYALSYTNGRHINILKDILSYRPVVMYFPRNSYLTRSFSDLIQNMVESGLIYYWIKVEKTLEIPKRGDDDEEPKVMGVDELLAPFILYMVGMCIAIIVFIYEKCVEKFKNVKFSL